MEHFNNIHGISEEKLAVIRQLSKAINDLPPELAIPYIAKANSELAAKNMSFTQDELNYILDQLTCTLPPNMKSRIEILRGMLYHSN